MLSVAEAERRIRAAVPPMETETRPLHLAQGAVLRQTVVAERDQPPFDRVTMDGIAIGATAWERGERRFTVAGIQGAGAPAMELTGDAQCVEIMTGAMLPPGADGVIPIERVTLEGGVAVVESDYAYAAGQNVHRRGSDYRADDPLLVPGTLIRAPEMAVLASAGSPEVAVARRPAVAVISVGDELIEPGRSLADYQIRLSNDRAIEAALAQRGLATVSRALLPDDVATLTRHIGRLHESHDWLVLSGGVSMGKYDYVPEILAALGIELQFHKVAQRPGKPMWFGVSNAGKPVFALPGNPVSTLVCLIRYVIPAIYGSMGANMPECPIVTLTEPVEFTPALTWFLPVELRWDERGGAHAVPRPTNTSGDFASLSGTAGFVELEAERKVFPAGHPARLYGW